MLAGRPPFEGSCAEVREQHLHAPLPWDQLQGVPQPVVVLLKALLKKDPARRFQTPVQLLQALATVTAAVGAGCTLSKHGLRLEPGRWDAVVQPALEAQSLTADDQLFTLTQTGLYLTATRGFAAPEARACYERVESLCHSLNRPLMLYSALMGQWRYFLFTDKLTATMPIAQRVYSLAQEQGNPALSIGASRALAATSYYYEAAFREAVRTAQQQKSIPLLKRAEASRAEYRSQRGSR